MSTTHTPTSPAGGTHLAEAIRAVADQQQAAASAAPREGRGWALAGLATGVLALGVGVTSVMAGNFVYGDGDQAAAMVAARPLQVAFHAAAVTTAVTVLVFAAGLHRHLGARTRAGSLAPAVATAGLGLVAVAMLLGSALDTEMFWGPAEQFPDYLVGVYGHWLATITWCWLGAGVSALAVGVAGIRERAVPAWLAVASLVLGGLTVLVSASPLQYMSVLPAILWVLLTSAALALSTRRRP